MTMCSYHRYYSGNSAGQSALLTSRAQFLMRTLLGLLILSITVSGNEYKVISGVGQDILLPCSCPNPVEVHWQVVFSNNSDASIYDDNTSDFTEPYKKRAKIFLAENNTNCSLLLSNITLGDQGKYGCYFGKPLKITYVTLNVSDVYRQKLVTNGPPAPNRGDERPASVIILSVTAASVLLLVVCLITYKRLRARRENTDNFII